MSDGPDGVEAAAQVNRERPVPLILVSGHLGEFQGRSEADYIKALLPKPVKLADLEAAIARAVSGSATG